MASAADLRRVVVIGMSGAGKSTVARRLAQLLELRHIELDALYWGPQWTPRPAFPDAVQAALQADGWVVDGNYGSVRDLVWPRATALVWLNLPFTRVLWQVVGRTLHRARTREVLWSGNRESWRRTFFSRESILWWVLTMHHRRRREHAARRDAAGPEGPVWIELRSPRQIEAWLRTLERPRAWPEAAQA
jgi:adenylate kinase family enzyme